MSPSMATISMVLRRTVSVLQASKRRAQALANLEYKNAAWARQPHRCGSRACGLPPRAVITRGRLEPLILDYSRANWLPLLRRCRGALVMLALHTFSLMSP
jgi:hypothetical protein